jgi:hypothetical protein
MATPNPRLYIVVLTISSSDNRLLGNAGIDTDAYPEPVDAAAVRRMAALITARAHLDGDLPTGQHYVVISWQRYGTPGGQP